MIISIQDEIERRHDVVGLFKDQAGLRGSLRDGPLRSCPDLDALKTKMQRKRAGLMEVRTKGVIPDHFLIQNPLQSSEKKVL